MARSNSASASSVFPDRASVWPRVVAAWASATPAPAAAAFGGSCLSGADDHDPRSKEQPLSVIASNAASAGARQTGRENPDKRERTGIAIYAEHSRAYAALVACRAAKSIVQKHRLKTMTRARRPASSDSNLKKNDQRDPRGPPPGPPRPP